MKTFSNLQIGDTGIQEQIDDLQKAVRRLDEREKFALTFR